MSCRQKFLSRRQPTNNNQIFAEDTGTDRQVVGCEVVLGVTVGGARGN